MTPRGDHGAVGNVSGRAGKSGKPNSPATGGATPDAPTPEAAAELLRKRVESVHFPLESAGAPQARAARSEILEQLDDHILPRLRRRDSPVLVVVGGSTGAGKSTLVNSLARDRVAHTGVRRPTTRAPVLVCHPDDRPYFVGEHAAVVNPEEPSSLPAESGELPRGVALLDTPDIDSVVDSNRELAARLIAVADFWLFVTTAARYADAVPWNLLRDARHRGATLAVTLNRMPRAGGRDVREHLADLLADGGFGQPPLFAVPETTVDDGRLPAEAVKNLRAWLAELGGLDRETVIRRALEGLLEGLRRRVPELAQQAEGQRSAAAELHNEVEASYAAALAGIDESTRDGSLLRGEVLIRWQELVETGDLVRSLQAQASRWRSGGHRQPRDMPPGGQGLESALTEAVAAAIRSGAQDAAERVVRKWRTHPAGAALLDDSGDVLAGESPEAADRALHAARMWQERVRQLVRDEGATKRSVARIISVDPEGLALVLTVGLLGYTGDPPGGSAAAVPRRLLKAVFGADSLRIIADKARADLRQRARTVLDDDAERFTRTVASAGVPDDSAVVRLYQATHDLEVAR